MFKFVLTRCGEFYIISTKGYHQDSHVPDSLVWAAGYFDVLDEEVLTIKMHGKSIGYDRAYSLGHERKVNDKFKELNITFEAFEKKWTSQDRGITVYSLGTFTKGFD